MAEWATLNGLSLSAGKLVVPRYGVWTATLELQVPGVVSGAAELVIDGRTFRGTIARVATAQDRTTVMVNGGANGWALKTAARPYHSDTGVRSAVIAEDVAREVGETIAANAVYRVESVGVDYARPADDARRALNGLAEFWGVREDGLTYVGARPLNAIDPSIVLLEYDTGKRLVSIYAPTLAVLDASCHVEAHPELGDLIFEGYRIEWQANTSSVWLVVNDASGAGDRMTAALQRIIRADATDDRLWGLYEYEVIAMVGNRVDLQITDSTEAVPNLIAVEEWLGPAIYSSLKAGALVGVMFRNGRRAKPTLVTCRSSDDVNVLQLGGPNAKPVARVGDLVQVNFPSVLPFSGLIGVPPATSPIAGTIAPMLAATGTIIGGSSKVGSA